MKGSKYEVEIKVEVTDVEVKHLLTVFPQMGFIDKGVTPQKDYYVTATESSHEGAYDIERYRSEAGKFFYTKKVWEVEDGVPVRIEDEREISESEFEAEVAKFPDCLKILKDRHWYGAHFEGLDVSLTIDETHFDHSAGPRYFMEAEIIVHDRSLVSITKEYLCRFVAELLSVEPSKIVEAPGMFAMAYKKL